VNKRQRSRADPPGSPGRLSPDELVNGSGRELLGGQPLQRRGREGGSASCVPRLTSQAALGNWVQVLARPHAAGGGAGRAAWAVIGYHALGALQAEALLAHLVTGAAAGPKLKPRHRTTETAPRGGHVTDAGTAAPGAAADAAAGADVLLNRALALMVGLATDLLAAVLALAAPRAALGSMTAAGAVGLTALSSDRRGTATEDTARAGQEGTEDGAAAARQPEGAAQTIEGRGVHVEAPVR
jgi:hypothetical protein